jgi:hypothetical protein
MYTCPMHPEVIAETAGKCPKCGMALVEGFLKTYKPLIIIFLIILLVVLSIGLKDYLNDHVEFKKIMSYFMAGFFLVFSGFKLLDLKGFAEGYATYDLLAAKSKAYAYIYPFIELYLGLSYLTGLWPLFTNILTFVVMSFSSLGVIKAMIKKRKFQCACLGTMIKIPLTKITLVEDLLMAMMALTMILMY